MLEGFDGDGFGVTPYAALQAQVFHTPSYSEVAASGSAIFALSYAARTITTVRTELGVWLDKSYAINRDSALTLFARAAWAHDTYSDPSVVASFQALPGSSFTEFGAMPVRDLLLLTAGSHTRASQRLGGDGEAGWRIGPRFANLYAAPRACVIRGDIALTPRRLALEPSIFIQIINVKYNYRLRPD